MLATLKTSVMVSVLSVWAALACDRRFIAGCDAERIHALRRKLVKM
jgi:hypothetical protein